MAKRLIRAIQWPKEKGQKINNDQQNTTQKTEDWETRMPEKPGYPHLIHITLGIAVVTLFMKGRFDYWKAGVKRIKTVVYVLDHCNKNSSVRVGPL
jgi:hypothetical protein